METAAIITALSALFLPLGKGLWTVATYLETQCEKRCESYKTESKATIASKDNEIAALRARMEGSAR